MGNGSARGRFAHFLMEVRFGWKVAAPSERCFTIMFTVACALAATIAGIAGTPRVLGIVVCFGLLSVGSAISDAWRTGHRILAERDGTARAPYA